MTFKIHNELELRAYCIKDKKIRNYSLKELSNAVSYFHNKINNIVETDNKNIGIVLGGLGFLQLALMLALVRSGRNYTIFYYRDQYHENMNLYCDHIFMAGPWDTTSDELYPNKYKPFEDFWSRKKSSGLYTSIFEPDIENEALHFESEYNLEFKFSPEQKIYISPTHEVNPKLAYNTGRIEESCIKAAIANYYLESDVVVLVRPFRHIGVATLSIYPAIFSTKKVTLCAWYRDWLKEYKQATHVHLAFEMIRDNWPLPEKLRIVTTGGYPFNSDCVKYVTDQSSVYDIVDCFGTAYCPPPLAIRYIKKAESDIDYNAPFVWVNDYIQPVYMLGFKSDDTRAFNSEEPQLAMVENGVVKTNDIVYNKISNDFWFYGSILNYVRVNHTRMESSEFIKFLKEKTNITKFDFQFKTIDNVKMPIILLEQHNKEVFEKFINDFSVEIIVIYQ